MEDIRGSIHTTQKTTLGPFENTTILGPIKNSAYHKRVNVSVEPLEIHKEGESKFCAVPGYTFLKPGSDRVKVMIKNLTARSIKVQQGSKVASMEAANIVPHMLAPQRPTPLSPEIKTLKSAKVKVSQKDLPTVSQKQMEMEQCTTPMGVDDVGPSEDPIEVAPLKPEVDRMPLPPDQMKRLFEQIKLEEGTSNWTDE